ncbi:MAG TPA: hypothetical protein VNN62_00965 [Methylomirabilota bacterium]|nr:hypothetical protein [Methylomirabilota bacterium]
MGTVRRVVGLILVLGLLGGGCGNDGSNDQGISFRAAGIFQGTAQENRCQVPVIDQAITDEGISLPLASSVLDPGFPSSSASTFCRGFLLLENNLANQSLVVDRLDFEYEIPGARIGIPATDFPTGIRILPADADPKTNPTPFGKVNVAFIQPDGQMVPARVIQFLRQNQPSLPQLPYIMIIHIRARGRTDNGEKMVSNETRYTIEFTN